MGPRTGTLGGRDSEKDRAGGGYSIGSGPGSLRAVATTLTCLPSALGYRERVILAKHPLLRAELGRLYNSSEATTLPVWQRLSADAASRRTKPPCCLAAGGAPRATASAQPPAPPVEPGSPLARPAPGSLRNTSGFVSNTKSTLELAEEQKYPLEFWAAARPRAATVNQTVRMLGMYEEDGVLMATMHMRPPVGVTPGAFLPDVRPSAGGGTFGGSRGAPGSTGGSGGRGAGP
ncbi:hypothetical protein Rsub_06531 [Raphidocelis subcapitata]|uniref:Uncharacterized protein n=1 Tax=Raphidocelis subcapitata TaxID=307507 RepID=A0A2V0P310_9CHLO|nr:hypothetical protein Rsub_06531 [Raphidocelis subcapitata]|eukprot:GBF94261.1 hypothetical protein Rsub_06531 [Raphidocelis subcapitata]